MKKNTFSNFTNAAENRLDEDANEIKQEEDGNSRTRPREVKREIEVNKNVALGGKFMQKYIFLFQLLKSIMVVQNWEEVKNDG